MIAPGFERYLPGFQTCIPIFAQTCSICYEGNWNSTSYDFAERGSWKKERTVSRKLKERKKCFGDVKNKGVVSSKKPGELNYSTVYTSTMKGSNLAGEPKWPNCIPLAPSNCFSYC